MSTITKSQQKAIRDLVKTMHIPTGLGTEEEACSLACINLALTGELTARIPDCMSEVIGQWIIGVQDRMPDDLRNSAEWKRLLPLAAGTGRDHEPERFRLLMVWMNDTVLVSVQPVADAGGYGTEWRAMTDAGSKATAADAADAAGAARAAWAAGAAEASGAAWAAEAADAAWAADAAGAARAARAAWAAEAADAADAAGAAGAARAAWAAEASGAAWAADAADAAGAADAAERAQAWIDFAPCKILAELIAVG